MIGPSSCLRLFVVALLMVISGCSAITKKTGSVEYATIVESGWVRKSEPGTLVLRTQKEWQEFWAPFVVNEEDIPYLDFESSVAAAIFWGAGFSGCQSRVEAVDRVELRSDSLIVHIGELPSLGPCKALVTPIQIIRINHPDNPIVFTGQVPVNE